MILSSYGIQHRLSEVLARSEMLKEIAYSDFANFANSAKQIDVRRCCGITFHSRFSVQKILAPRGSL